MSVRRLLRWLLPVLSVLCVGPFTAHAQEAINIADLVLAVRKGLIEAQQTEAKQKLVPMFLVKDFEMTITFVVTKGASGEVSLKVVTLGGDVTKEETHTVTIRSETAAFDHVKERLKKCLAQGPGPDRTYPACFNQAYKELGLDQSGAGIHR
jgi:Trypsin-co-occurring domain 2